MPDHGVARIKVIIWLRSMAGAKVTVWLKFIRSMAIQAEGSMPVVLNWVVSIHVGPEIGGTDSGWDWGWDWMVARLLCASIDWHLIAFRQSAGVLFGTGEPVCINSWVSPSVTDFRDKYVARLCIPVWLWVSMGHCVARDGAEVSVCGWHGQRRVSVSWGHLWLRIQDMV